MREMSLHGFMGHLASFTFELEHEMHKALESAAKIVEREAKDEIGSYQDQAGSVAPWAQLADSTVAQKERLGYAPPDNPLLRKGDLRDSIEHIVQDREAVVGSNSEIAVYQELGTSKMPPRSFLVGAATRKADEVARALGAGAVTALVGDEVHEGRLPISGG